MKINELINTVKQKIAGTSDQEPGGAEDKSSVIQVRNWYEERFDSITVQRNFLLVLLFILLCFSIVSIIVIAYVVNSKKFDPFVIQIDDTTGIAKIVNPLTPSVLDGNEAVARYFIKKYIIARETYNPVDFDTEAKKVIRLLSSNSVYWDYRGILKNKELNPSIKYGQKNTTYLTVKSWSKLSEKEKDKNKYMFRFSINETAGNMLTYNKIAVVQFQYVPMELTDNDLDVNPIGFQVTAYRVDDDNS